MKRRKEEDVADHHKEIINCVAIAGETQDDLLCLCRSKRTLVVFESYLCSVAMPQRSSTLCTASPGRRLPVSQQSNVSARRLGSTQVLTTRSERGSVSHLWRRDLRMILGLSPRELVSRHSRRQRL